MKLDNRGWGLKEMIIYSSILLICLLLAALLISNLYNEVNNSFDNNSNNSTSSNNLSSNEHKFDIKYYYNYEDEMIVATRKYLDKYPYNGDETKVIYIDTLTKYDFIERLKDSESKKYCDGFVKVRLENEEYSIIPYISCSSYQTKGY